MVIRLVLGAHPRCFQTLREPRQEIGVDRERRDDLADREIWLRAAQPGRREPRFVRVAEACLSGGQNAMGPGRGRR